MESFWQDVRYGIRTLLKKPGFAAVAILTLALGIGANTAIFSVVDAVLLRPLPFPSADRLIWANGKFPLGDSAGVTPPDFRDYRASTQTFDQFAAKAGYDGISNLSGGDKPEVVHSIIVSWNFFDTLGVHTAVGRSFVPGDEQFEIPQVAILGNGIWKREFGGDPQVVGKKIQMDGKSIEVVGVLATEIPMLSKAEIFQPMPMLNKGMNQLTAHFLYLVGRMKPGIAIGQARAELDAIAGRLAAQYPDSNKGWSLKVVPLAEPFVGPVRQPLLLVLGAVGLLLLIACANVANLLLARATSRRKEIAIRAALGASRGRIIRQMLTETLLLSLAGGGLGILGALWGVRWLHLLAPTDLPRLDDIHVNGPVLAFTIAVTLATGILFGLAPALQLSRNNSEEALKEGNKGSAATTRHRLGGILVVGEIALSVGVLIVGGLLVQSFWRLVHVNPGFQPDHVMTAKITLPDANYKRSSEKAAFIQELEKRLTALPGAEAAGAISELPLNGEYGDNPFAIDGRTYAPNQLDDADDRDVSAGYISAMHIPLLAGRWFDDRDNAHSTPVVVVNKAFADRYFHGQNPLGARLQLLGDPFKSREIVGIIGTVSHYELGETPRPEMYKPYSQYIYGEMNVVIRTTADPITMATAMQDIVSTIDKNEAVSLVRTMNAVVSASIAEQKFSAMLLGSFAGLALVLAAVGLYSLIAYTVTQRTREIGIRVALGASPSHIRSMVLGRGLKLTLAGATIGLAGGFGLAKLFRTMLFGIAPSNPATYIGVAALLTIVALAASYLPARRATRVDPMVALRYE